MAYRGVPLLMMRRIQAHGRGWVFSPRDFLDLGSRAAVDQALRRLSVDRKHRNLELDGHLELRRVAFGLYDYPRWDLDGTAPWPTSDPLAAAISRRDGHRFMRAGQHHAHDLGLTLVPATAHQVYLTDGPDRTYELEGRTLVFEHAGPRTMAWAGHAGAPVVLAIDWLGPQLAEKLRPHIARQGLTKAAREDLQRNLWMAPSYMQPVLRSLVGERRPRRRRTRRASDSRVSD